MTDSVSLRSVAARAFGATAITVALVCTGPVAALATTVGGTGSSGTGAIGTGAIGTESALQIQAQELAGQIQADGRNLDQLAESVDAAEIRSQQLASQLGALERAAGQTQARVMATRAALKQQAILDYLAGGAPIISVSSEQAGFDPGLTVSYAEIVAGGQKRAVSAYRSELSDQVRQSRQLISASRQAAITLGDLQADQTAAAQAFVARQQTLSEVKGRLASAVAEVEAAQQHAEQSAIEVDLAKQGQLPPPTPVVSADPASVTHGTTISTHPVNPTDPTTAVPPATRAGPTTTPSTRAGPSTTPPVTTSPPTTPPSSPPTTARSSPPPPNTPAPGWSTAVHYAYAQIGKPYQWGGAGPNSFDCSGLVMMAWGAAGVSFPHLAQDQYDMTKRIPLADALPGDLIFYGTPDDVYHVGIYIGGGEMIDAPETGENVSISSIYWANLLGAGRVVG